MASTEKQAIRTIAEEILKAAKTISNSNTQLQSSSLYNSILSSIANAPVKAQTGDEMSTRVINSFSGIAGETMKHLTLDSAQIGDLDVAFGQFIHLVAQEAHFDDLDVDQVRADIADIGYANIDKADIEWANINSLVSQIIQTARAEIAMAFIDYGNVGNIIIDDGVSKSMFIERLTSTSASFVNGTFANLVLKGIDGKYYSLVIDEDGTIHTQEVEVTEEEIAEEQTIDGRNIVDTYANFQELDTAKLKASTAIIQELMFDSLKGKKIDAEEAVITSAQLRDLNVVSATIDHLDVTDIKTGFIYSPDYEADEIQKIYPMVGMYPYLPDDENVLYPNNGRIVKSGFAIDFSTGQIYGGVYSQQIADLQQQIQELKDALVYPKDAS